MPNLCEESEEIILHIASFLPPAKSSLNTIQNFALSCSHLYNILHPLIYRSLSSKAKVINNSKSSLINSLLKNVRVYTVNLVEYSKPISFANLNVLDFKYAPNLNSFCTTTDCMLYLDSVGYLYTHLKSISLLVRDRNCDFGHLMQLVGRICGSNQALTVIKFDLNCKFNNDGDFSDSNPMKSLSQLSVLKKISISFSFGNNQFPPQLPRIFEELSVVESLRELELKFPFAFYESADSSISKLVDMGRLTTLKAEGTGVGRKLINSIAKCRSLISLTVAVTLMDFCCLLSSNRLPPLLCFHIVNSFFDRELPEEICFNFEGVKRFVVNCDFALPSEIHHEIKRSATDSVTLTEFGMRIWNIFDVRLSSTLSCVIPSLLNLEELSISTNYCEGEESTLFLISLHSNTRLKRLNLEAYVEQTKVFECLNRLLEISSCLEAVTITMESFPIFSLARMIRSIANNPSSVLKSLLFMCQSKFELRFWNNGGRRKLPMFVLHDSPPLNRKCDSVREIFKIIDRWDVDSDEIVVDTLVFDNLTHVEMQGLLKFLMIKEMSERNSRVKAGYLDGSICVWYDHDRS